jgi:hypothetical protein
MRLSTIIVIEKDLTNTFTQNIFCIIKYTTFDCCKTMQNKIKNKPICTKKLLR